MANTWLRLYSEIVNDPKVLLLTEALRWRYVALLCLHCDNKLVGRPDDEIAVALRISAEEWSDTRDTLIKRRLLNEDGTLWGWEKRQYISDIKDPTAAERQKRYRDKQRNDRNGTVTSRPPEADTDTDTEKEKALPRAARSVTETNGSRLPRDWELTDEFRTEAERVLAEEKATIDVQREARKFADFWHGKAGADGRKSDWLATWRNWIRKASEGGRNSTTLPRQPSAELFTGAL